MAVIAYDLHHPRDLENREALLDIKAAEQIPGKERSLYLFNAIRPKFAILADGKKPFVIKSGEVPGDGSLIAGANLERIPRQQRGG